MSYGKDIALSAIHPKLFDFQKDVVRWAVKKGRAAVFLDTGLGKTFVQLEWARLLNVKTIIIAPLSVARQTVRESKKIDLDVRYIRSQYEADEVFKTNDLFITNYEMIDNFDASKFQAVVLDESSILKSLDGVTRRKLIDTFQDTPYRLCCTATPAPNDIVELGNHSEFLGVMTNNEMQSSFFIHANKISEIEVGDGRVIKRKQSQTKGQEWRLRNYAKNKFYEWLSSWAISIRKPSDLGYADDGYILPDLSIQPLFVDVDYKPDDQLFFTGLHGIQDRNKVRKATADDRINLAIKTIVNS